MTFFKRYKFDLVLTLITLFIFATIYYSSEDNNIQLDNLNKNCNVTDLYIIGRNSNVIQVYKCPKGLDLIGDVK